MHVNLSATTATMRPTAREPSVRRINTSVSYAYTDSV